MTSAAAARPGGGPGGGAVGELDRPLRDVVGGATARALHRWLELDTVGDLLRHYPRRYQTRGELTPIGRLREGDRVTVQARVERVEPHPMRHRKGSVLSVRVTDGRDHLELTFFNQAWRARQLATGRSGLFAGTVRVFRGVRQLTHPDYVLFGDEPGTATASGPAARAGTADGFAGALIPIYPSSEKVTTWTLADCVRIVLDTLGDIPDPLPEQLRQRHGLVGLAAALNGIHRPESRRQLEEATDRLRFEEAFVLQVELARRSAAQRARPAVARPARPDGLLARFDAALPFELTAGQRRVGAEILADLAESHPMQRLLQGEVGSGKTVVALRAMLACVDAGAQAVLLAPTEVLAQQHYRSITELLGPLAAGGTLAEPDGASTRVELLTGQLRSAARGRARGAIASGAAGLVVGTHALLDEKVEFAELGLVVVDEQHRFGVEQRAQLATRSTDAVPHLLVMTATPIPRTVAMTVFGDLAVSTLAELPGGRADVQTTVVPLASHAGWLDRVWQRVREEVAAGRQAYVVCPRIGEPPRSDGAGGVDGAAGADAAADGSANGGTATAEEAEFADLPTEDGEAGPAVPLTTVLVLADTLRAGPLAGLRLAVLHGRLPTEEKDDVMRRFAAGEVDVLVSTTVVEVGVDVATASTMVVMDADRFGVSQLHQLRGRIGRGTVPGLCLLVTAAAPDAPALARLQAVAATRDGFALSQLDLEQRHEGDVLGAEQSGRRSSLRLLSVLRDEEVIIAAREDARTLVDADPELTGQPALRAAVDRLVERADYLERA